MDCLRLLGYQAQVVDSGWKALETFRFHDLILLDLDLPDIDPLCLCRTIRTAGDTPVIGLTTGGETERVRGLQAGADDCINKPYGARELVARIEAVMRRARTATGRQPVLDRGAVRIEPSIRQVQVSGSPVPLTPKEFDLLHLLATEPERVFTREELMTRVWQDRSAAARGRRASRTLDTHVGTLRGKIGPTAQIVTVRGVGYRLEVAGAGAR
ncbi:DNA-binding response OmpR family regulator [Krasilnikovia cinnamomea]|uniref:DNA-binding response OmpR family regulator n=1 Tax=Krasilnikovia cinnamomea TaxID=349313 RepID=A0A4Q7ZTE6_9ACTN|nr:DNA-binding response OmpR family regulator [Krasilnikovia cinnamomea]